SIINFFENNFNSKRNKNFLYDLKNSFIFLNNIDDENFLNKILKQNLFNNFFEYNGFFLNLFGKLRKSIKVVNSISFLYSPFELFKSLYTFLNLRFKNLNFY